VSNKASKLEKHREFIASERRKKTTYRRIAELLAEKGVTVDYSTIHAFVKVRAKPPRKVITMREPLALPADPNSSGAPTLPPGVATHTDKTAPELSGQLDAIRRLKEAKSELTQRGKGLPSFREDAPLDRLSDDEARRIRDKLEGSDHSPGE
jgi:hypothetical protein